MITSFSKVGWRVSLSLSSTLASIILACFHNLYTGVCPPQIPPLRWLQHQPRNASGILTSSLGSRGTAPAHWILVTEVSFKTPATHHRGCIDGLSPLFLWFLKSLFMNLLATSSHEACHTSHLSYSDLSRWSSLGLGSAMKLEASSSNLIAQDSSMTKTVKTIMEAYSKTMSYLRKNRLIRQLESSPASKLLVHITNICVAHVNVSKVWHSHRARKLGIP